MKFNRIKLLSLIIILILILPLFNFIYGAAEQKSSVFYPKETSVVLNNPYMGWAPWANGGPYIQPHRLVYINVSWAKLEPREGFYDFNSLELKNKFEYWSNKGVKIILRINMDYPRSRVHMDIPKWLYDKIKEDGTWYDIPYGKGFSPDYSNSVLIDYHKKLINALAARYDKNSLIPFIAIGSIGHWGEFHTYKRRNYTIPFPSTLITDQYVTHYINAFNNKYLLMRRPFQIAKTNEMGLFNDSFGDRNQTYNYFIDYINNGYIDYLTNEYQPQMQNYWINAPSGGEFADFPGLEYFKEASINQTLMALEDSHVSWLGPSFPGYETIGGTLKDNLNQVLNKMGYRFVVRSVSNNNTIKAGNSLAINLILENKGVAPFYYKWPLEISLSDSKGIIKLKVLTKDDITNWLPGEIKTKLVLNIPKSLAKGKYKLNIAIIDPSTKKPGIDLGISGRRLDGRYSLNSITVF